MIRSEATTSRPKCLQAQPLLNIRGAAMLPSQYATRVGTQELRYSECLFITLKNPINNLDEVQLLRVLYSLRSIIGFSLFYYIWKEVGIQNQQHLHAIIKKSNKSLTKSNISKWSKTFKQKKLKYLEYGQPSPFDNLGSLLEYEIDVSSCNFKITEITSQLHLNTLIYEYQFKELEPEFID